MATRQPVEPDRLLEIVAERAATMYLAAPETADPRQVRAQVERLWDVTTPFSEGKIAEPSDGRPNRIIVASAPGPGGATRYSAAELWGPESATGRAVFLFPAEIVRPAITDADPTTRSEPDHVVDQSVGRGRERRFRAWVSNIDQDGPAAARGLRPMMASLAVPVLRGESPEAVAATITDLTDGPKPGRPLGVFLLSGGGHRPAGMDPGHLPELRERLSQGGIPLAVAAQLDRDRYEAEGWTTAELADFADLTWASHDAQLTANASMTAVVARRSWERWQAFGHEEPAAGAGHASNVVYLSAARRSGGGHPARPTRGRKP